VTHVDVVGNIVVEALVNTSDQVGLPHEIR
jgi:hypothetical protein